MFFFHIFVKMKTYDRLIWYQVTENKDSKEGPTSNGNVTSISVSDDAQAQTVSKVSFFPNHFSQLVDFKFLLY